MNKFKEEITEPTEATTDPAANDTTEIIEGTDQATKTALTVSQSD